MPHTVGERVLRWDASDGDKLFGSVHEQIEFLARRRFFQYEPTISSRREFGVRLRDWLNSAPSEAAQKTMLRLVPRLFFVGAAEFQSLYQSAMRGVVHDWLISSGTVPLDAKSFRRSLSAAVSSTWFCPITDSMSIASFYHVNGISGPDYRPDWHSLAKFGDAKSIESYMASERFTRLVLLEDFVGTGSQMKSAVQLALSLSTGVPVLVVPLICCPEGLRLGENLESKYSNLQFSPVLSLPHRSFVRPTLHPEQDGFFDELYQLCVSVDPDLRRGSRGKYYGSLGYRDTGGIVVMHSNCPDNSLPLIHHEADSWRPLFPRSSRL